MNKNKILYVSDLDGTLLNRDAELSRYTTVMLNGLLANGLNFSVATARTLASTRIILANLSLHFPIILMNGVLIYDLEKQCYIKAYTLSPESVTMVIRTLRLFDITGFMYELNNEELVTYHECLEQKPLRDFVKERITRYNKTFQHAEGFSFISPENIIYFTLLDTHDRLKSIHDALIAIPGLSLTFYKDNYSPDLWYLELFSDKASKENAVIYLRDTYGYNRVVGFGDNLNDLPMFAACDIKIAVENANPEVKAAADYICDTNDNDGVAKWIEKNLL